MEELLNNYVSIGFLISGIVSIVVMIMARCADEEKLLTKIEKPCYGFGVFFSKFLIIRLRGKISAENFETGAIKTILVVASKAIMFFVAGMLSDNEKKKEPVEK